LEKFEIIAKTLFGFEQILATELNELGVSDVEILTRAVKYTGDQALLYKSNLLLRTAIKILKPIATFEVKNEEELYQNVKSIQWDEYMSKDQTFAIDGISSGEVFTHSHYVALKSKDAIVDQFRDKFGSRPSVNIENPDIRINIHIADTTCDVSLDSSGKSLGKRGYKQSQVQAPLSEVLAAGIILITGWDGKTNFIDPMCGSGTFPIEAALIARNIPPGYFRNFAFENWNDFDPILWSKIKREAKRNIKPLEAGIIHAYDIDKKAIEISKQNANKAGVDNFITFKNIDFLTTDPEIKNGIVIMNPPYGERMEDKDDIIPLYQVIGNQLKRAYSGYNAWILSGNLEALKFIGLRPSRKIALFNGPIDCRLNKFELFSGSKKDLKRDYI
jgi:putative N6-adenine-specific DNA methylase